MDDRLQTAIGLRKRGEHRQSRQALRLLLDEPGVRAQAFLNIAWSYDNEGKEREAEQAYRAALEAGLGGEDKFEAQFGLASTLRCLGEYLPAKALFEEILINWPQANEVRPFYALCLYNLGEHGQAMAILLDEIAQHPSSRVEPYKEVLRFYARHPDKQW